MFNDTSYYINREISWLYFNQRVLNEALDKTNPLIERLKFLAITSSNLDEFFMVRVSGILEQIENNYTKKDISGITPLEQINKISKEVHDIVAKQNNCFVRSILPALKKDGISFLTYDELDKNLQANLENYFESTLYKIITPMAVDTSHPFPLLPNKSLSIIVKLKDLLGEFNYAVVQVPTVVSRIIELNLDKKGKRGFIMLEDVIKKHIGQLFIGYEVVYASYFRLTRNSDLSIEEDGAEDLLVEIEKSIKKRKWGDPVRLEIEKNMNAEVKEFLKKSLNLEDEDDIYEISSFLDFTIWFKFASLKGFDHLKNPPFKPKTSIDFVNTTSVNFFEKIREKDMLVHHPYESFQCVIDFITIAANDPKVLAIKQTLYRVSGNSAIVNALIAAAENGKQVTVLVELKARFDEENNILWAKKLEKAGCHVVYGLVGLKTHCKVALVVRKDDDGIRRYLHLGTGNYNDSTAKLYTDFSLFTAKESFGIDASALFNVLTGYSLPPKWKKMCVAPFNLRENFLQLIENEKNIAKEGRDGLVIAKMNSLVDPIIIKALYDASCAGVKINLIVRGVCSLKSGIKGVSENIKVVSVIDKYLEHSRVYYFGNDGNPNLYLASADWMNRNLDRRIEVAFPIEQDDLRVRIKEILDITLSDCVKGRVQKSDGTYESIDKRGKELVHSQILFEEMAQKNYEKVKALNKSEMLQVVEGKHIDIK